MPRSASMTAGSTPESRMEAVRGGPVPIRPWVLLRYDTARFPFAAVLRRDVYHVRDLGRLHEAVRATRRRRGRPDVLNGSDNLATRKKMQDLPDDSAFMKLYHHFVASVLSPLVGRGLSYTRRPKMRIHFPGTPSVSSFHHDIIVTRRIDQVNFWMPFNDVSDSATLWLESDYGRADYQPVPVRYGEALIFDGGYLGHGSVANTGDTTRVSLDMRFAFRGARTRAEGVELLNRIIERIDSSRAALTAR
jgi:hypothetical protein